MTPGQKAARDRAAAYIDMQPIPCHCGATTGWDRAATDRHGINITIRVCDTCGTARTSPYPTPESLARWYERDYRALYSPAGPAVVWDMATRQGEQIRALLPDARLVYDVGTGTGGALLAYYKAGAECHGVDLGSDFLSHGRDRMPKAHLAQGSEDALKPGRADVVMAIHTLEHRQDLHAALTAHRALLAPDGVLAVELPCLPGMWSHYRTERNYLQLAHVWHFTTRTFAYAAAKAGLSCAGLQAGLFLCRAQEPHDTPDPMAAVETVEWFQRTHADTLAQEMWA